MSGSVGNGMNKRLQGLLLLVMSLQLSGCLLNRVYAFKEQFCDYQTSFALQIGDGVSLEMHKPVLRDTDVVWLLGAEPTIRRMVDGQLEMVYIVVKDLPQRSYDYAIPLHLRFSNTDGKALLSMGMIDRNLSAMITPGLIEETVSHACSSTTSLAKKNVEFDLGDLDREAVPDRSQIVQALGAPQQTLENGREIVYRFRLQGAGPEVEKSYARIWLEADGEAVERVRFRYLRYELDADFIAAKGSISIRM